MAKKALVVDDHRATADSLCAMLRVLGLEAQAAYGPRGALFKLEKFRPDVILLDLHMPGIEGYDVLTYLKRDPRLADVPVIVVTSETQQPAHRRALQTGALMVIVKPPTLEQIDSALRRVGILPPKPKGG